MRQQKRLFTKAFSILMATAMLLFQLAFLQGATSAAQITNRSLTLQSGSTDSDADGINDGGSMPGGVVNHSFAFTLPQSGGNLGSVKFEYCTTAAPVDGGIDCNVPTGVSTTATPATLGASTGDATFSTVTNPAANVSVVSRTAATFSGGSVVIRLDGVVNPSTANETFFVRISTYASEDATGSPIDEGTVAASTANAIELSGTMPESLVFCTGETVGETLGVPDCTTATAGDISFDRLFSPVETATATSQMAASTNAGAGYAITVNGPTLTSGSNTILPMVNTEADPPIAGQNNTSQFGMNLMANTTTTDVNSDPLGAAASPVANGTNLKGQAATDYSVDDNFKFFSSDVVANSYNGGAGGSDSQIFTVSYIVNVPGSQPAGTYTTTLTYICTPTF